MPRYPQFGPDRFNPFDPAGKEPPKDECNGLDCSTSRVYEIRREDNPPANCLFSTCTNSFAIRVHFPMVLGFDDGGSYERPEPQPIYVCPTHSRLMHAALEKGLKLRMAPEGFVWIDTTDYHRFKLLDPKDRL